MNNDDHSTKRQKLDPDASESSNKLLSSLYRPISPPARRTPKKPMALPSPFQLTRVHDLPQSMNIDTVTLKDILGDPLISECWEFNYLHDIDFLMEAFDEDVRDLVQVHVVHGFWKREDEPRRVIEMQAAKYKNVALHTAFMPEMFGTHHSKMLVLFRHDETAQIIIHTSNMIRFDWTNMTQAAWRSPLLPLLSSNANSDHVTPSIGSGAKFKVDFLNYLKAYDTKRRICTPLIEEIAKYDFSKIRAALVASTPGKQDYEQNTDTSWGWRGLNKVLKAIPVQDGDSEIIVQISSIATLGPSDKWLKSTFFKALSTSQSPVTKPPTYKIVFPTPDEIRRSLNGYGSGSAIHTKLQSAQQVKQLQYLKPMLYHWAADGAQHILTDAVREAGRRRAAPHIKTYVRYNSVKDSIDWMLVTSANLSKQAWGEGINAAGEIRTCSYEIGVIVWPELFGENAKIVPTFKSDSPVLNNNESASVVIGARMPYDLPLTPYAKDDEPWCATSSYRELDWMGQAYNV